jgi:hypothetical protein
MTVEWRGRPRRRSTQRSPPPEQRKSGRLTIQPGEHKPPAIVPARVSSWATTTAASVTADKARPGRYLDGGTEDGRSQVACVGWTVMEPAIQ